MSTFSNVYLIGYTNTSVLLSDEIGFSSIRITNGQTLNKRHAKGLLNNLGLNSMLLFKFDIFPVERIQMIEEER